MRANVSRRQTWIPAVAMVVQIICLAMLAFGEGQMPVFLIATGSVVIPMIVHYIARKTGHVRDINTLNSGEKTFDEIFPDLKKKIDLGDKSIM